MEFKNNYDFVKNEEDVLKEEVVFKNQKIKQIFISNVLC